MIRIVISTLPVWFPHADRSEHSPEQDTVSGLAWYFHVAASDVPGQVRSPGDLWPVMVTYQRLHPGVIYDFGPDCAHLKPPDVVVWFKPPALNDRVWDVLRWYRSEVMVELLRWVGQYFQDFHGPRPRMLVLVEDGKTCASLVAADGMLEHQWGMTPED
jgi:hypothetical protein